MNRFTFWRLIGSFSSLAVGCAESAIPTEVPESDDLMTDSPPSEVDELDGSMDEPDTGSTRDGSTRRDGSVSDAGDGGARDVVDAGLDAARPDASTADAGRDASTGTPDAGQPDAGGGGVTCSNGQTTCGNVCVTTATDINNCGGCGIKCGSGQTCASNQCTGGEPSFNVPDGCTKKTHNNRGYAFCTSTRSWRDARNACIDAGLDLAIVTDKAESDFVRTNGDSWIAVNDRTNEGRYQQVVPGNRDRVDGATASYTDWRSGEPNNTNKCDGFEIPFIQVCAGSRTDEDCTMAVGNGGWNDADCDERRGFVCEQY